MGPVIIGSLMYSHQCTAVAYRFILDLLGPEKDSVAHTKLIDFFEKRHKIFSTHGISYGN